MELVPFAEVEYRYTSMHRVDYGAAGGQFYGVMEGSLRGERLEGRLHLTNLATNRTDDVNTPGYTWLNTVFCLVEGILDTDTMVASCQVFECRHRLTSRPS